MDTPSLSSKRVGENAGACASAQVTATGRSETEARRVLCYGGIALDNILRVPHLPTPGLTAAPIAESYHIGGGAGHTAEWLASLGVFTRLSGNAIGFDDYGNRLWNWLGEYPALDLSFLDRIEGVNTPYGRIVVPPDGDRYMICCHFNELRMTPPDPRLLESIELLAINFYPDVNGECESPQLARLAHELNIRVVTTDIFTTDDPTLRISDVVINSAATMRSFLPETDLHERVRQLQAASGGIVILTDGSKSVFTVGKNGAAFVVAPPKVRATNATGAGDAFRAGLIYGMLHDWPLEKSVCWATAVGALQVQRSHAHSLPFTKSEVATLAAAISTHAA